MTATKNNFLVMKVRCPECQAVKDEPCKSPTGNSYGNDFQHRSRHLVAYNKGIIT